MERKRDLQSLVAKYRLLAAAAKTHEGELPSLARFRAALQATLEEIVAAKNRQTDLEALRREATQDLRGHVAAGQDAAIRLTSFVRANFGLDRKRLAAFESTSAAAPPSSTRKKKGGKTPPVTTKEAVRKR